MFGIPASGGPANLARFTPGFLRVLSPILPLGAAASTIRDVVYFGGHAIGPYLWALAAWALVGIDGLILVTALRRPAPALTGPAVTAGEVARPELSRPELSRLRWPRPSPESQRPVRRPSRWSSVSMTPNRPGALIRSADLLRARPGALHVVYADHALVGSDLSGFGREEMDESRDEKAAVVAAAVTEITAAAGTPYTFERRQESPAEAILDAASLCAAAEPAQIPILVTGRSHHATHQIIGSVPVRLLHQSPYPVLTIARAA